MAVFVSNEKNQKEYRVMTIAAMLEEKLRLNGGGAGPKSSGVYTQEEVDKLRALQAGTVPGPLTDEEKELIRTDPEGAGYKKVLAGRGRTCA
jgi:hypothetical protein